MSPLRSLVAVGFVFLMMGCAAETAPEPSAPQEQAESDEVPPTVDTNVVTPAKKTLTRKSGGN